MADEKEIVYKERLGGGGRGRRLVGQMTMIQHTRSGSWAGGGGSIRKGKGMQRLASARLCSLESLPMFLRMNWLPLLLLLLLLLSVVLFRVGFSPTEHLFLSFTSE